jgi:hypothetical protein
MTTKKLITTGVLACLLCSTNALCNPASTEFVNTSIDALRKELTTQIKSLNSGVGTIQKQVDDLPIITHHVGEVFQGGMIFWVDKSLQHGLIVSLNDLTEQDGIEWRNGEGGDRTVNARAKGLGAGDTNTRLIIAEQTIDAQEGQFAALLAANYQISADGQSPCATPMLVTSTCYGGWYLPSTYELVLLHHNLKSASLGQLADGAYWSSTEHNTTQAWVVDFSTGEADIRDKSTPARVRAIHSF